MAQKGNLLYALFISGEIFTHLHLTIIMKQESQISLPDSKELLPNKSKTGTR